MMVAVGLLGGAAGAKTYNEGCTDANTTVTKADGTTTTTITSDNCDNTVFLACKDSRCRCHDATFGVYAEKQIKVVTVSRSKRTPGKGKGGGSKGGGKSKGVSTGTAVAGGVAAAAGGYIIGSSLAGHSGSGSSSSGGSWSPSSSSGSSKSKDKYITVHSCFNRVGGDCAIDINIIRMVETSVTVNGSEIKSSKEINYKNRPECIQGAECKARSPPGNDTNVGGCVCKSGYEQTKTDTCIKVQKKNGAEGISLSSSSLALVIGTLLLTLQ